MAALTKQEKLIIHLKERLSTARTHQIILLEQIIALKAELNTLKEKQDAQTHPQKHPEGLGFSEYRG